MSIHPTASDRRVIVSLCCIAILALGVLIAADALSGAAADAEPEPAVAQQSGAVDTVVLKHFDPNTIDSLSLIRMGLSERKVRSFLHYRSAGKVFRTVDDVAATYGWTASDMARLSPYIRIAPQHRAARSYNNGGRYPARDSVHHSVSMPRAANSKFILPTKVDLNSADSITLCRIPGVGAVTARRIISHRYRLGGFYSVEQLLDIDIVSADLLKWFFIDDHHAVCQLNINTASFRQLNIHPYITYEQAKSLSTYRQLYGTFPDSVSLRASGIFSAAELQRLLPYVAF